MKHFKNKIKTVFITTIVWLGFALIAMDAFASTASVVR